MNLRILTRALGAFGTNCYILACMESMEAAIIDPGSPDPWIERTVAEEGFKPVAILLTHGHLDHIGGVARVKGATGIPLYVHGDDAPALTDTRLNGSAFFGTPVVAPQPDRLLRDGDELNVGKLKVKVLHTSGHTMGGVCYYVTAPGEAPAHLFAGDTLFAGSVGRSDLPGGDHAALIRSIREKLLDLPADTVVYPGHGPTTTVGEEREYNPYL